MVLKIIKTVWPVMLTYVAIGAPCGIGRQRFDKPWRFRRRLVAGLDSLDCGRRRRGGGNQDKVDVVVLRLGHRVLYRFELHIRAGRV